MTNEQRIMIYDDMYMTESVTDMLSSIVKKLINFLDKLKEKLFGSKLDKAVKQALNNPDAKNTMHKVPKDFEKATKETTSKFKKFCSNVKRTHGGNLVIPAALSAAALGIISSGAKTYTKCNTIVMANCLKDIQDMQQKGYRDLNEYYDAIDGNLKDIQSRYPKEKSISKRLKYHQSYRKRINKIAENPEKTSKMMKIMPEVQKYTKVLQYLSIIATSVFLGADAVYGHNDKGKSYKHNKYIK